jgi:hypothetical protein
MPRVSLVVAVLDPAATVDRLATLAAAVESADVEIVLAWGAAAAEAARLVRPGVLTVTAAAGTPLGSLRRLGMEAATGDLVVLVDEPSELDAHWLYRLCHPTPLGAVASTGPGGDS